MQTFVDQNGRMWSLKATVNALKRIRDQVGVDLTRLLDDKSIVEQAISNPETFVGIIYAWCEPQAQAAEIEPEEFGELMYGETCDLAHEAFKAELPLFFPTVRRTVVEALIRRVKEAETKSMNRALTLIGSQQVTATIDKALDQAERRATAEMDRIAGGV